MSLIPYSLKTILADAFTGMEEGTCPFNTKGPFYVYYKLPTVHVHDMKPCTVCVHQ